MKAILDEVLEVVLWVVTIVAGLMFAMALIAFVGVEWVGLNPGGWTRYHSLELAYPRVVRFGPVAIFLR